MNRFFSIRLYCVSVAKAVEKVKLNFSQLTYSSKVPDHPVDEDFGVRYDKQVEIDKRTVQLLERLSLVNLDGDEALNTLESSIQFAKQIEIIELEDKKPLYTVLEGQSIDLRSDTVNEGYCKETILQNAKFIEEDYFISPPGNIPLKQ